jgi:hypothetical protein
VEIPQGITASSTLLDRTQFDKARKDRLRPSYERDGLRVLQLLALRERDVRELYRGRAPYELLQNADDVRATRAVFVLTRDGLGFAHDGSWFSVANFISLAEGWSDKDPKECIGHKGIGFRSVLDITPSPHVLKIDPRQFFGFKFTWALNNGHIQETFQRRPDLKDEYRQWTRHGQSACPVMAIPGEAQKGNLGSGATILDAFVRTHREKPLTTFFWLPATDPNAERRVIDELGVSPLLDDENSRGRLTRFIHDEVSVLLPFLSSLSDIALYAGAPTGTPLAQATVAGDRRTSAGDEVRVDVSAEGRRSHAAFFQMHATIVIPPDVKSDPQTPKAVRQMDKASFRLSVRLVSGQPTFDVAARFHVYFPTGEPTGFGFTVHGDFHVMPDRTRLMDGRYNAWLFQAISKKFAGDFLTRLLERYRARAVFQTLRPSANVSHDIAKEFRSKIGAALRARTTPYIPTTKAKVLPTSVALPSAIDSDGFWAGRFDAVLHAVTGKEAFVDPDIDGEEVRRFLAFVGAEPLFLDVLLDLIEQAAKSRPPVEWWYDVYSYLAHDSHAARWSHEKVAGRTLIPDRELTAIAVSKDAVPVICLPPADDASVPAVPKAFTASFEFLHPELSKRLHEGPDIVRSWFLHTCGVVQFEATDLLPRAIAVTVRKFFDRSIVLNSGELSALWAFLWKVIALSRGIKADQFWQSIGRLPVPLELPEDHTTPFQLPQIAPAFLMYWAEGDRNNEPCVQGVAGYRKLAPAFVASLSKHGGIADDDVRSLLGQAGVSGRPKLLRYVRPVGGGKELPFGPVIPSELVTATFTGERQRDENLAVVENLRDSTLWPRHIKRFDAQVQDNSAVQEVSLIDGFEQAAQLAGEGEEADIRLQSLVRSLPVSDLGQIPADSLFKRAYGGGSTQTASSFLRFQLAALKWAPSSLGPVSPSQGFLRLVNRRFVSRGSIDEEVGDAILPYVVAQDLDSYLRLSRLGFQPLEDSSASTDTLLRFLRVVGERLATSWGKERILSARARWRLVRGAIQETYRVLNQSSTLNGVPRGMKVSSRVSGAIEFRELPLYYAEPGSATEQAFSQDLALFDADRPYASLFEALGVRRLAVGETVDEEFTSGSRAVTAPLLRDAIVNDLGPHLLAVVAAKLEDKAHYELVLRRLRSRFDVQIADRLTIRFRLRDHESLERSIDFPHFYLRRTSVEGAGAIRETHFTLYVSGRDELLLEDLDGDALGDALSPLFFDGAREDHSSLFPRIVSRFQTVKGARAAMEEFLLTSLGIVREAQQIATEDLLGVDGDRPIQPIDPPAASVVVADSTTDTVGAAVTEKKIEDLKGNASKGLERLLNSFKKPHDNAAGSDGKGSGSTTPGGVSREQEVRGRRGEDEFLRRIRLPGGWMGFTLLRDTRADGCGYDFLCSQAGRDVMVEIKTFLPSGRVVLSGNELRAAATGGLDYYLIGFLESGQVELWASHILQNPLNQLLERGQFDLDVTLQAKANEVFSIK